MWYDQTKGLPNPVVLTAMHEVGPSFDRAGVRHEDRATVIWDGEQGYLFASPEALRSLRIDPLVVPKGKKRVAYTAKPAGHIGEPGGYVPPRYPAAYKGTPLPNRLNAYILSPL